MARFGHASRRCGQIFVQWGGSLGVGSTEATAGQLFHPLWLRLNDPSQITRNQQRLFEMSSIMDRRNSWEVTDLKNEQERLSVQWGDGAQSYYPWHWLAEHATAGAAEAAEAKQLKLEVPKHLWNQSFQSTLPRMEYEALLTRSGKLQLCTYLERYGLAFVSGLGAAEGTVKKVGNYIGHVRVTNYGAIFDVKDDGAKATNLAFTNQKISAHTDNPYRDPFPGIQMLHCLSCAGEGGATLFTDGFSVAQKLKSLDPTAFHLLSNIEHPYEYRDPDAAVLLQASVPVIKLCQGEIERITFNNRSAAPMGPEMPELERYYEAWALFDRMANSMEFTVKANLYLGSRIVSLVSGSLMRCVSPSSETPRMIAHVSVALLHMVRFSEFSHCPKVAPLLSKLFCLMPQVLTAYASLYSRLILTPHLHLKVLGLWARAFI